MASRPSGRWHVALRRAHRIADRRRPIFDGAGAASLRRPLELAGATHHLRRRNLRRRHAGECWPSANIGRVPKHHAWIEILIGEGASVEQLDAREGPTLGRVRISEPAAGSATGWYDEAALHGADRALRRGARGAQLWSSTRTHPGFRQASSQLGRRPVVWDERLFR